MVVVGADADTVILFADVVELSVTATLFDAAATTDVAANGDVLVFASIIVVVGAVIATFAVLQNWVLQDDVKGTKVHGYPP